MSIDLATPEEWDTLEATKYDPPFDPVNRPKHYNATGIECIDYIQQQLGEGIIEYCEGNVIKYLHRWRNKNGLQDLRKAQWYLNKMVKEQEALE